MPSLVDLQDSFAQALTTGDAESVDMQLVGGANPRRRIAIHVRHYEASLTAALCDKFPASAWLIGADRLRDAARAYLRLHPPSQPCIAEYGSDFPLFLADHSGAPSVPYLASFAALEWAVGRASIATDAAPRSWAELSCRGPEQLLDSTLTLQPGVWYLRSSWRVDDLLRTYMSGAEPAQFVLDESSTFVEVRGARGSIRLGGIDVATFTFRTALAAGRTIGEAAAEALERDGEFDAGEALRSLAHAGLVTAVSSVPQEVAK